MDDDRKGDRGVEELLKVLDHPVPDVTAQEVMERAERRPAGTRRPTVRWAAGLALALGLGAGAAWAVPGSPVPGWVEDLAQRLGVVAGPEQTSPGGESQALSGISLPPRDALVIRFGGTMRGSFVRITLSEGSEVEVQSPSRETGFVSRPGELLVDHPTPDTVRLDVPRTSQDVEVWWHADRVWWKEGGVVGSTAAEVEEEVWLLGAGPDGG